MNICIHISGIYFVNTSTVFEIWKPFESIWESVLNLITLFYLFYANPLYCLFIPSIYAYLIYRIVLKAISISDNPLTVSASSKKRIGCWGLPHPKEKGVSYAGVQHIELQIQFRFNWACVCNGTGICCTLCVCVCLCWCVCVNGCKWVCLPVRASCCMRLGIVALHCRLACCIVT